MFMLIDHNILSTQITYLQKNTHVFDSSVKEEGRGGWVSGHHRSQNADSVLYIVMTQFYVKMTSRLYHV